MEKMNATSIPEFISIINNVNDNLIDNGADKHEVLYFRGQSDKSYELVPSLGRNRRSAMDISIFSEERNLIEMAKFKMPDVFSNDLQPIELLALLQHHGIPTRLLDITQNALVALYFSCCSNFDKDGEVIVFKNNELDITNYPVTNAIADSYRFARATFLDLASFYGAVISQPYFLEQKRMQEICNKTKKEGGEWIRQCCKELFFVYSPMRSLRQQLQQGSYILFPNKIDTPYGCENYCFETIIEPIPKDHHNICARVIIPQEAKTEILENLKLYGVSRQTMFADNIDIVCDEIVQEYKNKVHGTKY